ncbi:glycosyltransferase family 4 protein [Vibrio diabolicus]|uniref:glycosyltransferase family 4 protein n=1 Tax=Vibrio diabolicus TaxID=50719 RepID=UPI003D7DB43C
MRILHLCSYYFGSKVYEEICNHFNTEKIKFDVVILSKLGDKNRKVQDVSCNKILDVQVLPKLIGIFPLLKGLYSLFFASKAINLKEYSLIHAHTLFSDGVLAWLCNKFLGIKYIVTVRNTDLNTYLKKMPWTKFLARKIIESSEKVVFISHSYKYQAIEAFPSVFLDRSKLVVIPNGVSDQWLLNTSSNIDRKNKILFVGNATRNKNFESIIEALRKDIEFFSSYELVAVGIKKESYPHLDDSDLKITYMGKITDFNELQSIYCEAKCMVLASYHETFGLVYLEALSCGTPILYSKGQGFDGWFPEGEVGFSVNPYDSVDISKKLKLILNKKFNSKKLVSESKKFSWNNTCSELEKLYLNIF